MSQILAIPLSTSIIILVLISAAFVIAGGLKAIAYTNVFQMLLLVGVSILFVGMGTMSGAMKPLTSSPMFQEILTTVGSHWYLGVIAGALITAVLQSSSATTGILVALATAGALNINQALPKQPLILE